MTVEAEAGDRRLDLRQRIAEEIRTAVIRPVFGIGLRVSALSGRTVDPSMRGQLEEIVASLDDVIASVRLSVVETPDVARSDGRGDTLQRGDAHARVVARLLAAGMVAQQLKLRAADPLDRAQLAWIADSLGRVIADLRSTVFGPDATGHAEPAEKADGPVSTASIQRHAGEAHRARGAPGGSAEAADRCSGTDVAAMDPVLVLRIDRSNSCVRCVGTLDGQTRHHLVELVEHVLRWQPAEVTIDIEELQLSDAAAARSLVEIQRMVKQAGATLHWHGVLAPGASPAGLHFSSEPSELRKPLADWLPSPGFPW